MFQIVVTQTRSDPYTSGCRSHVEYTYWYMVCHVRVTRLTPQFVVCAEVATPTRTCERVVWYPTLPIISERAKRALVKRKGRAPRERPVILGEFEQNCVALHNCNRLTDYANAPSVLTIKVHSTSTAEISCTDMGYFKLWSHSPKVYYSYALFTEL